MSLQIQEPKAYPASKRTRWEILEELHNKTNWYEVEHHGWRLPANEEPHDWCGSWQTKGCLNVKGHENTEYKGKIFVKTYQRSCYRASCEKCHMKWIAREANKATRRIQKYEELSGKNAKHIIISPPYWFHFSSDNELKKQARLRLEEAGCIGGTMIFHPFRFNKDQKLWYYSPHFHVVGFGWIMGTDEIYKQKGWIIKNKGFRDSTFSTFFYILSHAGIKKKNHTITWFGSLSYSKLKIEKAPNTHICPLCEAKLRPVFHYGLFGWTPPPETEGEFFVESEGWRILDTNPFFAMPLSNCLMIYRKHKPRFDMI